MTATRKKASSAPKGSKADPKKKAAKAATDKKAAKPTTDKKGSKAPARPSARKIEELRTRIEAAPVLMVDPSKIHPAPWNKRKIRMDSPSMKRLTKNVGKVGVLQNGIGRLHPDEKLAKKGEYQMCGGHRRNAAAEKAGRLMPLKVVECSDDEARDITWMENAEREDIRAVEEALLVLDMMEHGRDAKQIAEALDKHESWVLRRVKLAELEQEWIDAWEIEPGEENATVIASFSLRHMEAVAILHAEARAFLFKDLTEGYVQHVGTAAQFEQMIERKVMHQINAAPWFDRDCDEILPEAGTCAACPHRTGAQGKLFADMNLGSKDDRCINSICWKKKTAAFIDYERVRLTTEHGDKLRLITRDPELQDGHKYLAAHSYQPKAQTAGGVPALHIDGHEGGKLVWIDPDYKASAGATRSGKKVRKIEKDAEGKPTVESTQMATEDRVVKLDRQRKSWCVEYIYEKLTGYKAKRPKATEENPFPAPEKAGEPAKRPASWAVIALSASGIGSNRKEWADPTDWDRYHEMLKLSEPQRMDESATRFWNEMVEVFSRRLRTNSDSIEAPFRDACELGALIGIPKNELWDLAKIAKTPPSSWAKDAEKAGFTLELPESPLAPATPQTRSEEPDESDADDEEFDDGIDA